MDTPQDVKARFLADHQALHPHPERIETRSFNRAASSIPAIWSRSATRCCAVTWSSGSRWPKSFRTSGSVGRCSTCC